MPAIQVYKHQGNLPGLIPVEEAKTTKAYRCPFTDTIVVTKKAYVKHLNTLRQDRMWANARKRRYNMRLEDLWSQPDFKSIIDWVEINSDLFWQNGKKRGWRIDAKRWDNMRDDFCIRITKLELGRSENISNTHYCPHNGVTNWGSKDDAPRGYPGWQGSIDFKVSHDVPSFFRNVFEGTRIHTGSGGGSGLGTYSYGVRLFDADWPGITKTFQDQKDQYERDHLIEMIKNEYRPYQYPTIKINNP